MKKEEEEPQKEVQSFGLLEDSDVDDEALSDFGSKPRTPIDIGVIEEHEDE